MVHLFSPWTAAPWRAAARAASSGTHCMLHLNLCPLTCKAPNASCARVQSVDGGTLESSGMSGQQWHSLHALPQFMPTHVQSTQRISCTCAVRGRRHPGEQRHERTAVALTACFTSIHAHSRAKHPTHLVHVCSPWTAAPWRAAA